MKIEITTQDYRDLLDILHIADVIMSGHRKEEDRRTVRHRTLVQKLYSHARDEGLGNMMGYEEQVRRHVPTPEFEESSVAHVLINEFGDHLFWDELINRLSVRDAAQVAGGIDRLNALNDDERRTLEQPIRQRYIREFAVNGLAALEVVERHIFGEGTHMKTSD